MAVNIYTPIKPTESPVSNKAFIVNATTYAGKDLYHTSTTDGTEVEYITLYATNRHTSNASLYVVWEDELETLVTKFDIPPNKPDYCFCAERTLRCGSSGYTINFYASVADVINIYPGFCYRVTPPTGTPVVNEYMRMTTGFSEQIINSTPLTTTVYSGRTGVHSLFNSTLYNYSTTFDYLTLYATNRHSANVILYLAWGDELEAELTSFVLEPDKPDFKITSERLFRGAAGSVEISAYASVANVVSVRQGFCYRIITP